MLKKLFTPNFIKEIDKQEELRADVAQILGTVSTRPAIRLFDPYCSSDSADIIAFPEERVRLPYTDEVAELDNEVN